MSDSESEVVCSLCVGVRCDFIEPEGEGTADQVRVLYTRVGGGTETGVMQRDGSSRGSVERWGVRELHEAATEWKPEGRGWVTKQEWSNVSTSSKSSRRDNVYFECDRLRRGR